MCLFGEVQHVFNVYWRIKAAFVHLWRKNHVTDLQFTD